MITLSVEMEREIERRRAESGFASAEEFLRAVLGALDNLQETEQEWLERELLLGLESGEVEMTEERWDNIEHEALRLMRMKKKAS